MENLSDEFSGTVSTTEITDPTSPEVATWKVRATPTLIAVRDGEEVGRLTGSAAEGDIRGLYTSATTGMGRRASITTQDRVLRLGAGVILGTWGLIASAPLLVAAGVAALLFGGYDLIPWRKK